MVQYNIFRKTDDQHRELQIKLWGRNLRDIDHLQRYEWFYKKNPYSEPISVLAETGDHRIVGNCSLYSRDLYFFGSTKRIGVAADFAVDQENRTFGPALKMQRQLVAEGTQGGYDFLFAFPNNNSRALFERVGYIQLGPINSGVKILKSRPRVAKVVRNRALGNLAAGLLDRGLSLFDRLSHLLSKRGYHARPGFVSAADYDSLWARAQGNYRISGVKDSSYIQWRFLDNPTREYSLFNVFDRQDELKGFVVYSRNQQQFTIEELFVESPSSGIGFLLHFFVMFARHENVDQITFAFLGMPSILRDFRKSFFLVKDNDRFCLIHPAQDGCDEEGRLLDCGNWFLFESEMDL